MKRLVALILLLLIAAPYVAYAARPRRDRFGAAATGGGGGSAATTRPNAYVFAPDGTNERCVVTDNANIIEDNNNFSVCCWVRYSGSCATSQIIGQWSGANTDNSWRMQNVASSSNCILRVAIASAGNDTGTNRVQATDGPQAGSGDWFVDGVNAEYNHTCFTYDGSAITLYSDAVEQAETVTGAIPSSIRDSALAMTIGADSAGANGMTGQIDSCSGWGVTLTQGNITSIYNNGVDIPAQNTGIAGLSFEYRMGDPSYTYPTIADGSTHGNSCELTDTEEADIATSPLPP